ncbi:mucin-13b isoform X2 [Denticeps clupeoides]|uniref:SEA domain-containing protein n=2 Tax=Denticeps clupeoides TaxID=299321 RepID=A0AAY4DVX6_9TELE|nr:protein HEG homolog 1-like isoform X2 [Denticeps clupeoides]
MLTLKTMLGKVIFVFWLVTTAVFGDTASTNQPPTSVVTSSTSTEVTSVSGDTASTNQPPTSVVTTSTKSMEATSISATTTVKPDVCIPSPCPEYSNCEPRFDGYACVCFAGLSFHEGSCEKAKVFSCSLRTNNEFVPEMSNKESQIFLETSAEIVYELNVALSKLPGYINSAVLSLRSGSVVAEVENTFNFFAEINEDEVTNGIKNADTPWLAEVEVTSNSPCSRDACDAISSWCSYKDGVVECNCNVGYIKTPFSLRSCTACPPGYKAVSDKCEKCSFGYSGTGCGEAYLLILVIVSSLLGGLLVITLVVFSILYSKKSKKSSKKAKSSGPSPQDFRDLSANQGVPRIPRVNANKDWVPSNLEMSGSGSTRNLVTSDRHDKERVNSNQGFSRDLRSHVPHKYSYTPQARQNPYFEPDEDITRRY